MSGYLPWKQIPDLLLTVVFLCAFCYVLIYGKTCDWYASPAIRAGTAIGLCAFGALLLKEASVRTGTYLDLHVFAYRNVWIGMLLFLGCLTSRRHRRPTTSTARPSPCGVSLAVCSAVRCLS